MTFLPVLNQTRMAKLHKDYELDSDLSRIQFERVHPWLTTTYWSPGISMEKVIRAAQNSSMVVGAFFEGVQVAYLRVVSDRTTFAWVCDVYVDETHRGNGLAKTMLSHAMEDPDHQNLRRWLLATKDAHRVYDKLGFEAIKVPSRWMVCGSNPSE